MTPAAVAQRLHRRDAGLQEGQPEAHLQRGQWNYFHNNVICMVTCSSCTAGGSARLNITTWMQLVLPMKWS